MKRLALLAAVGALGLASSGLAMPANAAPLPLIKAGYWCGPGWHRDYWGRCVPNAYSDYGPTFVFGFHGRDRDDLRFRGRDDFRGRGDFQGRGDFRDRGGDRGDRGDHGRWR